MIQRNIWEIRMTIFEKYLRQYLRNTLWRNVGNTKYITTSNPQGRLSLSCYSNAPSADPEMIQRNTYNNIWEIRFAGTWEIPNISPQVTRKEGCHCGYSNAMHQMQIQMMIQRNNWEICMTISEKYVWKYLRNTPWRTLGNTKYITTNSQQGKLSLLPFQCNAPSADPYDDLEKYVRKYLKNTYDNIWETRFAESWEMSNISPQIPLSKAVTAATLMHQVHIQMIIQI